MTDLTMSFRLRYESVTLGILSPMDTDKVGVFGFAIIRVRGWTVEMGGGPGGPYRLNGEVVWDLGRGLCRFQEVEMDLCDVETENFVW